MISTLLYLDQEDQSIPQKSPNIEATHLIITPKVTLADFDGYDTKYGKDGLGGKAPGYRLVNSNAPIEEFDLDEIIVPIEQ